MLFLVVTVEGTAWWIGKKKTKYFWRLIIWTIEYASVDKLTSLWRRQFWKCAASMNLFDLKICWWPYPSWSPIDTTSDRHHCHWCRHHCTAHTNTERHRAHAYMFSHQPHLCRIFESPEPKCARKAKQWQFIRQNQNQMRAHWTHMFDVISPEFRIALI